MRLGGSLVAVAAVMLAAACSRERDAATKGAPQTMEMSAAPAPSSSCSHAVCADNFFVDVASGDCVAGSPCSVSVKLAATGAFHINDQYPYRFRADDQPGVDFLGSDPAGKNAFSKGAGDWQKLEEKAGVMNVKFTVANRGTKTIGGTLKLSVCSAENCLLEQRPVAVSVLTK